MAHINKKYIEDFEKLQRDWERLKLNPNAKNLEFVCRDLNQLKTDLEKMNF